MMKMMMMKTEACAKVNFTLEVFAKRVDGYHALRSVVMPVSLADTLELTVTEDGRLTSDTGYADDLCVKAARVLRDAARRRVSKEGARVFEEGARVFGEGARVLDLGCRISVVKRIPAGGGLGGGSADAAAVLRALNRLWQIDLPLDELAALGAEVGSDVPALVLAQELGAPVLMEGRGERVAPLLPDSTELQQQAAHPLFLVLANPGVFSSTPEVFRACTPRADQGEAILRAMREALVAGDGSAIAAALQNDLEAPACRLHPEIAATKAALVEAGAEGVLMSGSGATVFGLVSSADEAERVAAVLRAKGFAAWAARTGIV